MRHYCIQCGAELGKYQIICPGCGHNSFMDDIEESFSQTSGLINAVQIEANTQWRKYMCGKDGSAGHGFAAEDANAWEDRIRGSSVDLSGRSNELDGPDRIVDGVKIQTKYYKTATESINQGFKTTPDGFLSYEGQIIEVPKDQYEEALTILKRKITDGEVPGHTNPEDASKLIKKGSYTYRQAKNIARAGNIDSIVFDAKTQSIGALTSFGVSFAMNVGLSIIRNASSIDDIEDTIQAAYVAGLQNGTITLSSGILASQVLRTPFGRHMAAAMQWTSKKSIDYVYTSPLGKKFVHNLAETLNNKGVYGGAAKQTAIKFIRTNAITSAAVVVVTTIPDTYHLVCGHISSGEFFEKLIVNSSSIAGATLGGLLGSYFGPYGAMLGGVFIGGGTGWISRKVARKIRKSDEERMHEIIRIALLRLSNDFLIQDQDEFERCYKYMIEEKALDLNFVRFLYSVGKTDHGDDDFVRVSMAYLKLSYFFGAVIRQRKTSHLLKKDSFIVESIGKMYQYV